MRFALAAVGFSSTIAQIVLMRELIATFYGNELLFGLVLMAWLAWVAVGSWGLARLALNRRLGTGAFAMGLVLAGVLLPAQITLVRQVRALLGVIPGAFVEFGPLVGAVILILAPLCLLVGFLFTLGTRLTVARGGSAGQAYVWESVGAVTGGAFFSFALIRWLDPFQTALLVAIVNLATAANLWLPPVPTDSGQRPARARAAFLLWPVSDRAAAELARARAGLHSALLSHMLRLGVLALLLLGSLPLGRALHQTTLGQQWSDLAFAADSPYGRLVIQARDGQRVFFENGLLAFETQGTFPEEVVHFPLLAHPNPKHVLLIGGGVAGDLREILKHPIARATYVELDPLLIEAAQTHLPPPEAAVLNDPRVKLILTDGRLYVKSQVGPPQAQGASKATPPRTFDVVILDLPEPSTGALNRFYTREFFAEAQAILNPGGIFALGLPAAENYWSPELARRNGSVYHTLRTVFPEILALPGEHNFFFASDTPLEANPAVLVERLAGRSIDARRVTPGYIEYVFTTDRFAGVQRELEATTGVRLNSDLRPICYYYSLTLWLSRFYPNLSRVFQSVSLAHSPAGSWQALGWIAVSLILVVTLARWRRGWAVPIVIAGIGLAQMTLEVVILFAFQVLHGYVYAELGLIVTAFMAGLTLGGAASNRLSTRREDKQSASATNDKEFPFLAFHRLSSQRGIKWMLIAVQITIIVYSGLLPLILWLPIPAPALVFPLLALLAGLFTGMAFPLAVVLVPGNVGRVAGMLYGVDLVGGCLGALLGATLFIPVLGIPQTCAAIALVGLAGLLAFI